MTTRELTKQLKKIEHALVSIQKQILWHSPKSASIQQQVLEKTGGAWKRITDPVAWQRKIRTEWNKRS